MCLCLLSLFGRETPSIQGVCVRRCLHTANSGLTDKVYLSTIVTGRVLWHLGYTTKASDAAFTASSQEFQRAALTQEPTYRVRGVLIDGFDSTTKSMRILFPGARLGTCLRHALLKLPKKLVAI